MAYKVFICYKKVLRRMEGDKIIEEKNTSAETLHFLLGRSAEFEPWMDEVELGTGMEWETEIYRKLLGSDVLIVLVGIGTSQSEWVKREIAMATALGITVFPLGVSIAPDKMVAELKGLGIDHLQGRITHNLKLTAEKALLSELRDPLNAAGERTRMAQRETLKVLFERRYAPVMPAPDNQRSDSFILRAKNCSVRVHVASGRLERVKGIDALVNSENDYMQMARFFEIKTVSSILRRLGASTKGGRYEDIIQRELDAQLQGWPRPVQVGEAVVTSAGDPNSELAQSLRARYIIHVAAVQAVVAEGRLTPFKQAYQVEKCARAVLAKVLEINQAKGVISPPGTDQRAAQEKRAAAGDDRVRSLIMPLFGTGSGGGVCDDVLPPMLEGIRTFFDEPEGEELAGAMQDLYISAYSTEYAEAVVSLLDRVLERV